MFWAEIWKLLEFLSENFQFLVVKFSIYLNRRVFIMVAFGNNEYTKERNRRLGLSSLYSSRIRNLKMLTDFLFTKTRSWESMQNLYDMVYTWIHVFRLRVKRSHWQVRRRRHHKFVRNMQFCGKLSDKLLSVTIIINKFDRFIMICPKPSDSSTN